MLSMDLFNQTLLFVVYFLVFGLLFSGLYLIGSQPRHKHSKRALILIAISAVIGGIVSWWVIQSIFPEDVIPFDAAVWVLPIFFALGVASFGIRNIKIFSIGVGAILSSIVLLGLVVNNYYHYFPTLQAVMQNDKTVNVANQSKASEDKKSVVFEQYYKPLVTQPTNGQLAVLNIPSSTTTFSPREGRIYLPPALHGNDQIKLPVLVLLAGHPGSPIQWEQAGLLSIMDNFAKSHNGLTPIIAVVDFGGVNDADTECVDSKLGSAETYLVKDVPAYLKQHYQVQTDAGAWGIVGYSAGGTCSSLIALRNPSVYQNFVNISGDSMPSIGTPAETLATLFNGSQQQLLDHTPNHLLEEGNSLYSKISGSYFYGKQDNAAMVHRIQDQYNLAKDKGLNVVLRGIDGHHGFTVWKEGFVEGLPWISNQMKLTVYDQK